MNGYILGYFQLFTTMFKLLIIIFIFKMYAHNNIFKRINLIPNGLEKYMTFTINKNLVFIVSEQFMNYSLDALVKNLSDNDFK